MAGMLFGSVAGILLQIMIRKSPSPEPELLEGIELGELSGNMPQQIAAIAETESPVVANEKPELMISQATDFKEDSENTLTPTRRSSANDIINNPHVFFRSASFDETKKITLPTNKRRAYSF
jgi:hypothetical protein